MWLNAVSDKFKAWVLRKEIQEITLRDNKDHPSCTHPSKWLNSYELTIMLLGI